MYFYTQSEIVIGFNDFSEISSVWYHSNIGIKMDTTQFFIWFRFLKIIHDIEAKYFEKCLLNILKYSCEIFPTPYKLLKHPRCALYNDM